MRTLYSGGHMLTLLALFILGQPAVATKQESDITRIEVQLSRHLGPKAINPKILAPVVYLVSRQYNIPQELLTKVIIVESNGIEHAVNNKSKDYGIAQIHVGNGDLEKIECAMRWQCALPLAAKILAKAHRICSYNLGNAGSKKFINTCLSYERKIASIK